MPKDESFHEYVVDLLRNFPGITSRGMFSGWALYQDGIVFALIAEGELYFKSDKSIQIYFEQADSHPFVYMRKDSKPITLAYWSVPEEVLEDEEALSLWTERSVEASKRAGKTKE
ncbi:MAG: TfoX/Sxy family protein [Candidatus Moranbacteria bacterium]|nr:TfoX/Sxy family protein [Candidatus Moranbacteria bacterium]